MYLWDFAVHLGCPPPVYDQMRVADIDAGILRLRAMRATG